MIPVVIALTWLHSSSERRDESLLPVFDNDVSCQKGGHGQRRLPARLSVAIVLLVLVSVGVCLVWREHWLVNLLLSTGMQQVFGLT